MTTEDLAAAIDGLYTAFRAYERPPTFEGCECCWDGEPIPGPEGARGSVAVRAPGGTRPLRQLAADELGAVATQMPHLGGTVEVLKHYLPRLLEITATEGFDYPEIQDLLSRLNDVALGVCWIEWADEEQTAVRRFLHALWHDRLSTPAPEDPYDTATIDDIVCALGGADPDIEWYLAEWLRFDQPYAARHLEAFLATNVPSLAVRRRLGHGWWRSVVNHDRVVAWIHDPATTEAVAAAADRPLSQPELAALAECYLRWL